MGLKFLTSAIFGLLSLSGFGSAYTNPIRNPNGADPFITYFEEWYYFLVTEQDNIQIARAESLESLKEPERVLVYADVEPSRCCNMWAPEIHFLEGSWYLYYSAGSSGDLSQQRAHVLKGGATPWDPYTYAGQLTTEWDIDGTILTLPECGNYFVSSCMTGVPKQAICIRPLNADFVSLGSELGIISQPDQPWEQVMDAVNEGPAPLYIGGRVYITYSGSQCASEGYCLATLQWNGGDPMAAGSWTKSPDCVFSSANGHYGTGHNSFFTSPDDSTTYNTFHATSNSAGSCVGDRYTMVQPVTANEDGSPNFGEAMDWSLEWPNPS